MVGQVWEFYGKLYLVIKLINANEQILSPFALIVSLSTGDTQELNFSSFGMTDDVLVYDPYRDRASHSLPQIDTTV